MGLLWGSGSALGAAPHLQSLSLQNQAMCLSVSSLLKINSSLQNGENQIFCCLAHCRLKFNVYLNLHVTLFTFGKHCSTHVMSWLVCLCDLLLNEWVCIFFWWGSWATSKRALFLIEEDVTGKAGEILRQSHCHFKQCCHTLVEIGSSPAAFCFFLNGRCSKTQ